MHTKRIIPCLDVTGGRVVKGINFVNLRDAGDPVEIAKAYDKAGADELVFLDITASSDARNIVIDITNLIFSENAELNFDSLKSNVKISSMLNNKLEEKYNFSNLYFESWMMNCDEERFSVLIQTL